MTYSFMALHKLNANVKLLSARTHTGQTDRKVATIERTDNIQTLTDLGFLVEPMCS